ncbi:synaptic vesicle glycoprotein 2B isoform X1 [Drosophila montana]|uniref:synaptic vesicle glycoprotein 2B isoform X1 n=1 Tax=Drosophila montana TaxID=40370 RepID=UPI00313AB7D7
MAHAGDSGNKIADFETAIAECGFGLFNVFIMICAMPCLSAMVFSASSMSYVMPTAECELKLTVLDKGLMNAVTYAGMIISAMPWGFVADTMGRRLVLITGGWIDGICVLCSALSQNSSQLMIFKFFDGLVICGPFAVVVSYLAEFHGRQHRHYIMLFVGLSISIGALTLPIMAYFLLPVHIYFTVGKLRFHTWQIFLALTSVPSLLSGFLHIFLPESPKFLMSQGYYSKALASLQRIYAVNKRKSRDSYPIKTLTDATPERTDDVQDANRRDSVALRFRKTKRKFIDGLKQLKPMCTSPYLGLSVRVYCLHFCQIMCVNSVRLWLPQIFATMHTFEVQGISDRSMCAVLGLNLMRRNGTTATREECDIHQQPETYRDNIIVAGIGLVGFLLIFPLLSIRGVANHILKVSLFLCTFLVGGLYFATSTLATLMLAAVYLTVMGICASTVIGMCVVVFPTLMRTMVLLLIMTFGRLGSVTGNILLPFFIQMRCWAPFLWLSSLMAIAFTFSLFLKVDVQQSLN